MDQTIFLVFIVVFAIVIAVSLYGKSSRRAITPKRVGAGSHDTPGAAGHSEADHDQGERAYTDYGHGTK